MEGEMKEEICYDCEALNELLRQKTGMGQGEIDSEAEGIKLAMLRKWGMPTGNYPIEERMKEPTEEQIRKLWEWCGFEEINGSPEFGYTGKKLGGSKYTNLNLDLNNLFKWAVPKVAEHSAPTDVVLARVEDHYKPLEWVMEEFCLAVYQRKDPALALFWTIWWEAIG